MNCLAQEDFRKSCKLLDTSTIKRNQVDTPKLKKALSRIFDSKGSDTISLRDIFEFGDMAPRIEEVSAGVFDIVIPFQEHLKLYRLLPGMYNTLKELEQYKLLDPMRADEIYPTYQRLSQVVHGVFSSTDTGRESEHGQGLFEDDSFKETDLCDFLLYFLEVVDISLVITLNFLSDGLPLETIKDVVHQLLEGFIWGDSELPHIWKLCDTLLKKSSE